MPARSTALSAVLLKNDFNLRWNYDPGGIVEIARCTYPEFR